MDAIKSQRLAKYQICISASKIWDAQALIEFFGLKFRYSSDGRLLLYVDWGGRRNASIPTQQFHDLRTFLGTQSPTLGTTYTHCFLFGTDRKPLDQHTINGLRQSIRQAEKVLEHRMGFCRCRIVKLTSVNTYLFLGHRCGVLTKHLCRCLPGFDADARRPAHHHKQKKLEAAHSAQQSEENRPSLEINDRPGNFVFEEPTWLGLSPPSAQRSPRRGPRPRLQRSLVSIVRAEIVESGCSV